MENAREKLNLSARQVTGLALAVITIVIGYVVITQMIYQLDARNIVVMQSPLDGALRVITEPGPYFRFGSTITEYPRRSQYSFSAKSDVGDKVDQSLRVRFNDGGGASVSGVSSWEMPLDEAHVIRLHKEYGSFHVIDQQLIRQTIELALSLSSPLVSSTDSYAARRAEFLQMFADQAQRGIYKTKTIDEKAADPVTGVQKTVKTVQIILAPDGNFERQGVSQLEQFGIKLLPPTIDNIKYDDDVEAQIRKQRDATMQVQTAQANAREAEQAAITAEKNGQARAAEAKWRQEVVKAEAVVNAQREKEVAEMNAARDKNVAETGAQRELNVATLKAQAAEQIKQEQTLLGEGEAARKKAVMGADGALEQKLKAYVQVALGFADSLSKHQGPLVPSVVMGGGSGNGQTSAGSNIQALMDIFTVAAAKNLGLDMGIAAGNTAGAKQ